MFFATGRLRRRVGQEGSAPQVGLQVLQVVPGQRLPGTVHTRGGGRFRGGESGACHHSTQRCYEIATSTLCVLLVETGRLNLFYGSNTLK